MKDECDITDRVSGEGNVIGGVRPSVCFHSIDQLPLRAYFNFFACL